MAKISSDFFQLSLSLFVFSGDLFFLLVELIDPTEYIDNSTQVFVSVNFAETRLSYVSNLLRVRKIPSKVLIFGVLGKIFPALVE